tara:strand:+ start:237 stop:881 length:645 start_codon:yes stop_codon:yes gene_type:complete
MGYIKIGKNKGYDKTLPRYQFKEILDSDYEDISSIRNWFDAPVYANVDYIYSKDGATGYMDNNGGFSSFSENDRIKLAKNFCVDKADRDTVISDDEQELSWDIFVYNSHNARNRRWNIARSFISYRLTPNESSDLGDSTDMLTSRYLRYGIESEVEDGKPGIYDWIKDENHYSGGTGFSSKSYYSTDLRDGIIDRLNGNVFDLPILPEIEIIKP